ncbi:MAG: type I 3-dehydroquinate dehydratase [Proteobacteria bacterium]|nr:type I 3-dehydroquinate dehydratase [Pseudomonadota bacterium]MBU1685772.1 type I 3-dehydroquinate dehydratase [Pseudomonadota bacterium]
MNKYPGKICISIATASVAEALATATAVQDRADLLEIRLDSLDAPEIAPFLSQLSTPVLFTCRPAWEGGFFQGTEDQRLHLLSQAIEAGAPYIDLELNTDEEARTKILSKAHETSTKVIISWHDFKTTPSSQGLASILQKQYRSGADIGKIVTMANSPHDMLRVFDLYPLAAEMGFPLCAFSMGNKGVISRLTALELGGYMTYGAPEPGKQAAPGQLSIDQMRTILEIFHADD